MTSSRVATLGVELTDYAALGHDDDAVGGGQRLGHFRCDVEDGQTFARFPEKKGEDLALGAHVDAAGWLVEKQHLR